MAPHHDNCEPLPEELRVSIILHPEQGSIPVVACDHEYTMCGPDSEDSEVANSPDDFLRTLYQSTSSAQYQRMNALLSVVRAIGNVERRKTQKMVVTSLKLNDTRRT